MLGKMGTGSLARCARQSNGGKQDVQLTLGLILERAAMVLKLTQKYGYGMAQHVLERGDDGLLQHYKTQRGKGLLPAAKR